MRIDYRLSEDLFPYQPRWLDHNGIRVHYVDEGTGRPILFLHGNPTSSFLYRGLIERLKQNLRCVAADYPGFGLSGRPESGYGYTPWEHAEVVEALVTKLDLNDLIVMGQDWGGPIGIATALQHQSRTSGLVFANTWYWPVEGATFNGFSLLMGSPPMQWLILKRNFFVRRLIPAWTARPLPAEVMEVYRALQPTPEARRGVAQFPKEIRRSRGSRCSPRELRGSSQTAPCSSCGGTEIAPLVANPWYESAGAATSQTRRSSTFPKRPTTSRRTRPKSWESTFNASSAPYALNFKVDEISQCIRCSITAGTRQTY